MEHPQELETTVAILLEIRSPGLDETDSPASRLLERPPLPALRPFVLCGWRQETGAACHEAVSHRILPAGERPVMRPRPVRR